MVDDLFLFSEAIWHTLLEAIPQHLKFGDTDQPAYSMSPVLGIDINGNRKSTRAQFSLKDNAIIYIEWSDSQVQIRFVQRPRITDHMPIESIKSVPRWFQFNDPKWLSEMVKYFMEIIVILDARHHIIKNEPYVIWKTDDICASIIAKLTE